MFRRQRRTSSVADVLLPRRDPARHRRWRWLAMAAALVGMVGAGVAVNGSADASTGIVDSFEGNPYDRWTTVEVRGQSVALLENRSNFPRTGSVAPWLYGGQTAAASARMHRLVSIEQPANPIRCYGVVWMRKHNESPQPTDPVVTPSVSRSSEAGLEPESMSVRASSESISREFNQPGA